MLYFTSYLYIYWERGVGRTASGRDAHCTVAPRDKGELNARFLVWPQLALPQGMSEHALHCEFAPLRQFYSSWAVAWNTHIISLVWDKGHLNSILLLLGSTLRNDDAFSKLIVKLPRSTHTATVWLILSTVSGCVSASLVEGYKRGSYECADPSNRGVNC